MPEGVIKLTDQQLLEVGKPVDFSFKHLTSLEGVAIEGPRSQRIGQIPVRGAVSRKYLTRSIWLNNNKLPNMRNMDVFVNTAIEDPTKLGWIDFSILYLHGNSIKDMNEVFRIRPLKQLKTVTFHGNPIAEAPNYRHYVITYLPQVVNLDFSPITLLERFEPKPPDAVKKVSETSKR
ncbi:hypothetical protein RI129_012222 [Pyrocoelia pectoralis]|uniref:Leucine-rich repeat-containing protein 51 n=1 Tax=Pyrocoelia pectoralis TaxID=417401 RepID=A0AAN7ZBS1_9COLE